MKDRKHYFMLWNPVQKLIRDYVEIDEPRSEYSDDEILRCILEEDDEPFYEYPGIVLPAYLKFTDDSIDVYSGEKIGNISKSCEEYVHDVVFYSGSECECQVALSGGMCANIVDGQIYREFEDYFGILEITEHFR